MKQLLHTVMWRLQGDVVQRKQLVQKCVAAFLAIRDVAESDLQGMLAMQITANDETLNNSSDSWHLVLMMRFASQDDLERYNQHPLHLHVKALMAPIKQARAVVDAWIFD
jgi:hypothetical protein